jgi:predicted kinase
MIYLIMMIGIPGSGKSTLAKSLSLIYDGAKIFSSDEYREKLLGSENDQSNNQLVFNTLYKDIAEELHCGYSCILDATNISYKDRNRAMSSIENILRKKIKSNVVYKKIATVCCTNISECIENDKKRERSVGENVILKFVSRFEYPQYFEGFNNIIPYYGKKLNIINREDIYSRMSGFNQNSKYHKYDLLTHSMVLSDLYSYSNNALMSEAAKFHDIGKLFTESKDEEGFSHFYQHANYSAYIIACNPEIILKGFILQDVIFYINQHMHIRDIIKSEKAVEKYKKLWGEERFNKLVEFMNNDNKASGRNFNE